jgi:hypothetical protein
MIEDTPMEIWIVQNKLNLLYPTGRQDIKPRRIRKGIPFNVSRSKEIIFWQNLIKNNPTAGYELLSDEKIAKLTNASVVDEVKDAKYIKRRLDAESKIRALELQIKSLASSNESLERNKQDQDEAIKELEENLNVNNESNLNNEILELTRKLKRAETSAIKAKADANKAKAELKKKNQAIQKVKNEVK